MPTSLATPRPLDSAIDSSRMPPPTQIVNRGWLIVRLVLGTLLVVTAVLKMSGGSSDALRSAMPFVSPRLYASGVMAEFILGVWLLSGLAPAWSWLCSLGLFGLLAVMSFQLGITGQASGGCLGKVQVSPWWAFGVDMAAMGALLAVQPGSAFREMIQNAATLLVTALILVLLAAFSFGYWGSWHVLQASAQGATIATKTDPVELGQFSGGVFNTKNITVTNISSNSQTIVGGTTDCSCIATTSLPVTLAPGESAELVVRLKPGEAQGAFSRTFALYVRDTEIRRIAISVVGTVSTADN